MPDGNGLDKNLLGFLLGASSSTTFYERLAERWLSKITTWGVIYELHSDSFESVHTFHTDATRLNNLITMLEAFPADLQASFGIFHVSKTGSLEHIKMIPKALLPRIFTQPDQLECIEYLGYQSTLTVPLIYEKKTFAVVQLVRGDTQAAFSQEEASDLQAELHLTAPYIWRLIEQKQQTVQLHSLRREKRRAVVKAQRYQERLAHYPLSTMILSHDGFTLAVNKAFNDFWGIKIEDDVAYNLSLFKDKQLRESGFLPIFERALAGEAVTGPPTFYDAGHTNGGNGRWFRHVISPIKRPDGRVRELIVVHVPLANEEQLEAMRRLSSLGVEIPEAQQTASEDNPLSPREHSVLLLISEGCTNKEIADVLAISENTVKFHITSVFNKLGVNSRAMAVSTALEKKFI